MSGTLLLSALGTTWVDESASLTASFASKYGSHINNENVASQWIGCSCKIHIWVLKMYKKNIKCSRVDYMLKRFSYICVNIKYIIKICYVSFYFLE